jgi:hypothetical protein
MYKKCGLLVAPLDIRLAVGINGKSEKLRFASSEHGLPLSPFALAEGAESFALRVSSDAKQDLSGRNGKARSFSNVEPCRQSSVDCDGVEAAATPESSVTSDD